MNLEFEVGETDKGVIDVRCSSWLGFMAFIDHYQHAGHGIYYRGQLDSDWPIEASLYRATKSNIRHRFPQWDESQIESIASDKSTSNGGKIMQVYAAHLAQSSEDPVNDEKAWMYGRHQGLLTPFVDWTRSPYVAAFFATVEVVEKQLGELDKACIVYGVSSWLFPMQLSKTSGDNGILKRYALQVDAAKYGNQRAIAQQAVATYLYPQTDVQLFVNEVNESISEPDRDLYRITLPYSAAEKALTHLNRMNVNYQSLFPDPYGMAKHANLGLYSSSYSGAGNWMKPPGFDTLIPEK